MKKWEPKRLWILEKLDKEWNGFMKKHVCAEVAPVVKGLHNDAGKVRWDLLPYDALNAVAEVMTYGQKKYPHPERNWELGINYSQIFASGIRHSWKWFMAKVTGQNGRDEESGLPHIAHAVTNFLFLLTYETRGMGEQFDDRPNSTIGTASKGQ